MVSMDFIQSLSSQSIAAALCCLMHPNTAGNVTPLDTQRFQEIAPFGKEVEKKVPPHVYKFCDDLLAFRPQQNLDLQSFPTFNIIRFKFKVKESLTAAVNIVQRNLKYFLDEFRVHMVTKTRP